MAWTTIVKAASSLALWLNKSKIETIPQAGEIWDKFESEARKVPREICFDAEVEAKKAITFCLKDGLSALKKSLENCLLQADMQYLERYLAELKETARTYLGLHLETKVLPGQFGKANELRVSISSPGKELSIELCCQSSSSDAGGCVITEMEATELTNGAKRAACDKDLSFLLATCLNPDS